MWREGTERQEIEVTGHKKIWIFFFARNKKNLIHTKKNYVEKDFETSPRYSRKLTPFHKHFYRDGKAIVGERNPERCSFTRRTRTGLNTSFSIELFFSCTKFEEKKN